MITEDEPIVGTNQLEIVGFNGTPLSDYGNSLPVVYDKLRDRYFKDRGNGSTSATIFYCREEIEDFARQGRLTLLNEPSNYDSDAVVLYVKEEFYEELYDLLSKQFVWQQLNDSRTRVAISNAHLVDRMQDVWAKELLNKSTQFLGRFFIFHDENARNRAERLADMALVSASTTKLRHDIYVCYSSAILASEMPERFLDLYSLYIAKEFIDDTEVSFRDQVKAFEYSLKVPIVDPKGAISSVDHIWSVPPTTGAFLKGSDLVHKGTGIYAHASLLPFHDHLFSRNDQLDKLIIMLIDLHKGRYVGSHIRETRYSNPFWRESILGYAIQVITRSLYLHPVTEAVEGWLGFGSIQKILEGCVARRHRNRSTRIWMRSEASTLDLLSIKLLYTLVSEAPKKSEVARGELPNIWLNTLSTSPILADMFRLENSAKYSSSYQLISQFSRKVLAETTDEASAWHIAMGCANKFRRQHLLGDKQIKKHFEDIALLDRDLCPYSIVFGALPATYKSAALDRRGDLLFVNTRRIMEALHEQRLQKKPMSPIDTLFYNAHTKVVSRQR